MMKTKFKEILNGGLLLFLIIICLAPNYGDAQGIAKELPQFFEVRLTNPMNEAREEIMVFIPEEDILRNHTNFNPEAFAIFKNKEEIPSQYNQNDPVYRGIVFVIERMSPKEVLTLKIQYKKEGRFSRNYTKRTQAEISHKINGKFEGRKYIGGEFKNVDSLRVPDAHTDHSNFVRYEGPGWESDKVGYRYYLDWRNAVDVFGKKAAEMVLQEVGLDGFSSYHEMAPWGMDVMKVGESLGIGSIAYHEGGKARRIDEVDSVTTVVSENGPVFSAITTNYFGWKVADGIDLTSHLCIHAGSRLTHQQILFAESGTSLCTGIGKDKKAKTFSHKGDSKSWGYLATYGPQSLNGDNLGVAVLFQPQDFIDFTEDAKSHIVRLKERYNAIEYCYLAAWELEPGGIKDEAGFLSYLQKTAEELANPVMVNFK